MLRPNFDETAFKDGKLLEVSGPGDVPPDMTLLSRSVAIQQPPTPTDATQYAAGAAPLSSKWTARLDCGDARFITGEPVLAIGTETYFAGSSDQPSVPATFFTVTWSEVLELKDR